MINRIKIFTLIVILSSCTPTEIPDKFVPQKANEFAINYIDSLKTGNLQYCYDKLSEGLQNNEAQDFNLQIHEFLMSKNLISKRIISSNSEHIISDNPFTIYNLSYEYQYSDSLWEYFSFRLKEAEDEFIVQAFKIQPSGQPLSIEHEFIFQNKSVWHFVWFIIALIIPIFILVTLIFLISLPLKRKWLWIIFVLLGVVSFSLNWTSGEIWIKPINFKLLGAGIIKSGIIAPWILSFSIPFGAIVFWFKRSHLIRQMNKETHNYKVA